MESHKPTTLISPRLSYRKDSVRSVDVANKCFHLETLPFFSTPFLCIKSSSGGRTSYLKVWHLLAQNREVQEETRFHFILRGLGKLRFFALGGGHFF